VANLGDNRPHFLRTAYVQRAHYLAASQGGWPVGRIG